MMKTLEDSLSCSHHGSTGALVIWGPVGVRASGRGSHRTEEEEAHVQRRAGANHLDHSRAAAPGGALSADEEAIS